MGRMRHHAIVVTGFSIEDIRPAWKMAQDIGLHPSIITDAATNGYQSFFVPPDGSKEGWAESDRGDMARDEFITWLRSRAYSDGSSDLRWVEVHYGDDELSVGIDRDSDELVRREREE